MKPTTQQRLIIGFLGAIPVVILFLGLGISAFVWESSPYSQPTFEETITLHDVLALEGGFTGASVEGTGDGSLFSKIALFDTTRYSLSLPRESPYETVYLAISQGDLPELVPLDSTLAHTVLDKYQIRSETPNGTIIGFTKATKDIVNSSRMNTLIEDTTFFLTDTQDEYHVYLILDKPSDPNDLYIFEYILEGETESVPEYAVRSITSGKPLRLFIYFGEVLLGTFSSNLGQSFTLLMTLVGISNLSIGSIIMIGVALVLLYLAIAKEVEPVLLVPIAFGAILVNIPLGGIMDLNNQNGILYFFYAAGILTEIFPALIFVGIGAMTDFGPLLENPKLLIFGAAGQFGIFFTLILAMQLQAIGILPVIRAGFDLKEASSIAIIGAADGPSAIYLTSQFAPHILGPVTVCAYSYMALVPIIQTPIIRLMTTHKQRALQMPFESRGVSKRVKIAFPIIVTLLTCFIAPLATPLMGSLMLGNFLRECGVVDRLRFTSENEIANIVTLLLGITIGATMSAEAFLRVQTVVIFLLGIFAFASATFAGLIFGQFMHFISRRQINPMLGACGISAFPMSARVVHAEARKADPDNFLIFHAMGANAGGQIGSVVATGMLLLLIPFFSILF